MIVTVFRLVVMKFCSWLPSAMVPQTSTIAVQGLEPSRISDTMSWSCPFRNMFARTTVTTGAMIQLENRVSRMGLGFLASFLSSSSLRLRRAGYIIRKRQMPMGIDMPLTCQLSIARLSQGMYWDNTRPTTMQRPTQMARYLSNNPRLFSSSDILDLLLDFLEREQINTYKFVYMFFQWGRKIMEKEVVKQLNQLLETQYCDAEDAAEHGSRLRDLADTFLGGFDLDDEARVHGALSDVNRLKILKLLGFREMCVCELTAALDINQPNLSYHIKKLESAGLVRSEKRGKWVYYSIHG